MVQYISNKKLGIYWLRKFRLIAAEMLCRPTSRSERIYLPVQILFCDSVVIESICNHTRANELINESNMTGGLRKMCTDGSIPYGIHCHGMILEYLFMVSQLPSKFFSVLQSYCSRSSVGLFSYDSRSTLIRLDWRKNLDGIGWRFAFGPCASQQEW